MPWALRFVFVAQLLVGLGISEESSSGADCDLCADIDDFAMTQASLRPAQRSNEDAGQLLELKQQGSRAKQSVPRKRVLKGHRSLSKALIQLKRHERMHVRASANPKHVAGEAVEHGEAHDEAHNEAHHTHGFIALLFFFGTLTLGSVVLVFFERYCPSLQSTNVLFLCGALVSLLHDYNTRRHSPIFKDWFDSVDMWQRISPHMIFFAFLPVLIFGEAMQMKTSLFRKSFGQILMLACPGVLLGTILVASFAMYVLPYPWEWPVALAFGSVLSATDPVAVVALFNTLGVSPRLTMLVSGESLLNDGTAICVFTLVMNIIRGSEATPTAVLSFFARMCGASVLIGCCMGFASCVIIGLCANGQHRSDSMVQFLVTLCCAYLSFFITDAEVSSSGVLAVVSSGLVVAHIAWPRFVNRETILEVWEAMLFIANTVIFFLAGLLFTNICLERADHITTTDYGFLLALYVALHLIRAFMMAVLWYPIQCVGDPISVKEGSVMVWSGLRGAVSLAMAISFDLDPAIDPVKGSRMMFHVGGIAMLTMFINSGLTPALLRLLGLTKLRLTKGMVLDSFNSKMQTEIQDKYCEMRNSSDVRFAEVSDDLVRRLMPELTRGNREKCFSALAFPDEPQGKAQDFESDPLLQLYRECFIRLLAHSYWAMIEEGVLPKNYHVTQLLLQSCEENLDTSASPLSDWSIISRFAEGIVVPGAWNSAMSRLSKTYLFSSVHSMFRDTWDLDIALRKVVCASLCFRAAHARARAELRTLFGQGEASAALGVVQAESERQCEIAEQFVKQHANPDVVVFEKAKMTAQALLHHKIHHVHHMKEQGMLNGMEADLLEGESLEAVEKVLQQTD
jgi:NhaP-type Na+/H+ or K+/H+ antiporter